MKAYALGHKASDAVGSLGVLLPIVGAHRVHRVVVDAVVHAVDAHQHGKRGLYDREALSEISLGCRALITAGAGLISRMCGIYKLVKACPAQTFAYSSMTAAAATDNLPPPSIIPGVHVDARNPVSPKNTSSIQLLVRTVNPINLPTTPLCA